ncbi:MAG: GNAT family N-acetyltransferase [Flavobacteriaceae bacterium]|nr:GNAT family N-acetyltransferase [Flavobacteriaceae bacterium]
MIRLAKASEIEEIITITRACAKKMSSEGIHQWNEHYPNIESFLTDLKRDELYVLIKNDTLAGCVTISTFKDEVYEQVNWLSKDSRQFYIHRLAIHPQHQHKGNARLLMDFAEALAREKEVDSIRLDTFSKNIRNQRFYEARGYIRLANIYFPKQSSNPFYCYELLLNDSADGSWPK